MNTFAGSMAVACALILTGCGNDEVKTELRRLCEQAIKQGLDQPDSFSVVETRDYRVRDGGHGIVIKYNAQGASSVTGGTPVTTCTIPHNQSPRASNLEVLKDFDPYRYR